MMYLLDTNVISEIRKIRFGSANKNVAKWADDVDARELYLSVITVEELEIGVLLLERRDPKQGSVLRAWLDQQVLPAFEGRILEIDMAIVLRSAHLHVPNPKPLRDGLIAATALVHSMTVVTRNVDDFKMAGVKVFDPW
ncbi:MAG: type II toxin-antitoxin system VapC family toxin [Burkholderiales bacterium]|nr:type II toxin-antitoxin system VapC family toxin [Burkholderiales bacterium]